MSNPEEIHAHTLESRDHLVVALGALSKAKNELTDATNVLQNILNASEAPSNDAASYYSEVVKSITEQQESIQHFPELVNPFLLTLGTSAIKEIVLPPSPNTFPVRLTYGGEQTRPHPPLAPSLSSAARENDRTNKLEGDDSLTEQQGLQEVEVFLKKYLEVGTNETLRKDAESILKSLNFIGKKELDTACTAIAEDWQAFLSQDEKRQILIIPSYNQDRKAIKSGERIKNKIIDILPETAKRQVVEDINLLKAPLEATRVIAVDDWTLSGKQMSVVVKKFCAKNEHNPYTKNLEINFVIATPRLLNEGFTPLQETEELEEVDYVVERSIPVKACYTARLRHHPDNDDTFPSEAHITGTHSNADFGFALSIEMMGEDLTEAHTKIEIPTLGEW